MCKKLPIKIEKKIKMKILYVITGLAQGGAERVVCDLADKMYEKGHEVKIIYLVGDVLTNPVNQEIELVNANLTNVLSLPKVYLSLLKIIKEYRPDVVHSHMVHANILTRLVRVSVPIKKLISTAHSDNEGGRLRMVAYRITNKLSDVNTNVSKSATLSFEHKHAVPRDGMKTIYNGIDLVKFKYNSLARAKLASEIDLNNNEKIVLVVGRFSKAKNYPNLLRAVKYLKVEFNLPFKLVVAGDGELKDSIKEMIQEMDLKECVILLGMRSDIPDLMSAADVFVLASENEGFGLVLAEAMACECPVVASNVGGIKEVVGNYGIIVKSNDHRDLAKAIFKILSNEKKYKSQAKFARAYVLDNFDLNNIANQWELEYIGLPLI